MTTQEMFGVTGPWVSWPERELWLADDRSTRRALSASRRSGKTSLNVQMVLCGLGDRQVITGALCPPPTVKDPVYGVSGPSEQWLAAVYLDLLVDSANALVPDVVEYANRRDGEIKLRTGATIKLLSWSNPQKALGMKLQALVIDEAQGIGLNGNDAEEVDRCLLPTLLQAGGRQGWLQLTGCPQGFSASGWFFENWKAWSTPEARAKGCLSGTNSAEVMYSAEQLAAYREHLSDAGYRSQFLAEWVDLGGQRALDSVEKRHLQPYQWNGSDPLIFAHDFNVAPATAVVIAVRRVDTTWEYCPHPGCPAGLGQRVSGWGRHQDDGSRLSFPTGHRCSECFNALPQREVLHVIDEVHLDSGTTRDVCDVLAERYAGRQTAPVYLAGDASGSKRTSNASDGETDWSIIRAAAAEAFGHHNVGSIVWRKNEHVRDRINKCNQWVGYPRWENVLIDSEAVPHLMDDLRQVNWTQGTNGRAPRLDSKSGKLGHLLDGLTYGITQWLSDTEGGFHITPL